MIIRSLGFNSINKVVGSIQRIGKSVFRAATQEAKAGGEILNKAKIKEMITTLEEHLKLNPNNPSARAYLTRLEETLAYMNM